MSIQQAASGYALKPHEGKAMWLLNGLLTWKVGGQETGGEWELVEQLCPRGFAPPSTATVGRPRPSTSWTGS